MPRCRLDEDTGDNGGTAKRTSTSILSAHERNLKYDSCTISIQSRVMLIGDARFVRRRHFLDQHVSAQLATAVRVRRALQLIKRGVLLARGRTVQQVFSRMHKSCTVEADPLLVPRIGERSSDMALSETSNAG